MNQIQKPIKELELLRQVKPDTRRTTQEKEKLFTFIKAYEQFGPERHSLGQRFSIGLALVFLFALVFGVLSESQQSLPNSFLYPVKLLTEQVSIALAATPSARAQKDLIRVGRRIQELNLINDHDNDEVMVATIGNLNNIAEDLDYQIQNVKNPHSSIVKKTNQVIQGYQNELDYLRSKLPQYTPLLDQVDNNLTQIQIAAAKLINGINFYNTNQ